MVLAPLLVYVWVTGLPVPAAEPSPKSQLNVYGAVPPVTVAVKVTGLPTVGFALTVKLADNGRPATLIVWLDVAVALAESVTVSVTIFAPVVVYVWVTGF